MAYHVVRSSELEWVTRPHEPDEAPRHAGPVTDAAGFTHSRANLWRYEPGGKGRRHRDLNQEETFVPISGQRTVFTKGSRARRRSVTAIAAALCLVAAAIALAILEI